MATLDQHTLFVANDQIVIMNALSTTEVIGKKMDLYSGLAIENDVRDFFKKRSILMKRVADDLRKHLDRLGGS